ncbi:hypothetical protein L244_15055 [Salmonella enterica subsp. enterica serovar Worthington str. BCH-3194]|nr:hypothetical protein L245_26535 [Salmonella enterica subsp. enterica serovar Worthington str. BCH-4719]KAF0670095.1 hypothetical protein L244_15055 [Salmonella enterica subsp. enterica serovar Worthington str. BCH-3194]KAF0673611.1 hypothetical protein L247_08705 [Salmonella enterica subsp. enterica serovar Worthington str. BCH-7253]KAF0778621.1 hypothetical protein L246_34445 [Salmonella enterica subsp. enterica serovar Worthington str. BCH-5715]KAF0779062.1 hypothetical protein L243_32525 
MIDTNQFVFLHNKVHGISKRNACVDMFLNNNVVTEWRVVKFKAVVALQ